MATIIIPPLKATKITEDEKKSLLGLIYADKNMHAN